MELKVGEKIMVFRQRKEMKLIELGEAFKKTRRGKDIKNAHIKLKKIELGELDPSPEELKVLAEALDQDVWVFAEDNIEKIRGLVVPEDLIEAFPKLKFYIETLVTAFKLKDDHLIKTMTDRLGVTEPTTDKNQAKKSSSQGKE